MSVVLEFPEAPQFEFLIDLQGQSLYQKWLELGNVGTESDFLNWLKLDSVTISGTGTTGYLPKFTSAGVLGNGLVFDNGTNVGIGTISPASKFQVRTGTNENSGFFSNSGRITLSSFNDAASLNIGFNIDALDHQWMLNGMVRMSLKTTGNLILNTTDNGVDKLQVNGSGLFIGKLKALCPIYANESAATADSTLLSGQFYKLTGSKQVYQKD